MSRIVTVDIGGTAIKSALCLDGVLTEKRECPTEAGRGAVAVLDTAAEMIRGYGMFDAIGISTAGQVDTKSGVIKYANENLPGYTGMRVKEIVENIFLKPVVVENDVNCAALGETFYGAGRGFRDFLCLTYGTGVGGAIILDRKLYTGHGCSAGEFGGILIHPEDVKSGECLSGCYENYASTRALVETIHRAGLDLPDGKAVFLHRTDPTTAQIIDAWIDEICYGLVSLIHILNPEAVILGGGVMEQDIVPDEIQKKMNKRVIPGCADTKILKAELGNNAGMLGAAYLARKRLSKEVE